MKLRWRLLWIVCFAAFIAATAQETTVANAQENDPFRAILESSGVGSEAFAHLGAGPEYSNEDWQIFLQIFNRLKQFRDLQSVEQPLLLIPKSWRTGDGSNLGQLFELRGQILAVKKLSLPDTLTKLHDWQAVYRCKFEFSEQGGANSTTTILTTHIPKHWQTKEELSEPVRLRGALVQFTKVDNHWHPLLLTDYLAWYPTASVSTGQLLLARAGMDIALLDEVRHRKPFVKPEVSREGEAFYAALTALNQVHSQELAKLAKENVARVAASWRAQQSELQRVHQQLQSDFIATTDDTARETLQQKIKQAKTQRGLAAAVLNKAEVGQSSVAPMFLQPEKEVGELFVIEGIARRAVRIATERRPEPTGRRLQEAVQQPGIEAYYEIEVFTSDSQNLPIVCCVCRLPVGFPTGDEIRESVRIPGIFFKSWRYRSRKLVASSEETSRQRQQYNPVPLVLGNMPIWLQTSANRDSRWAIWGGIAFLGVLATLWISLPWLARRDRRARASLRKNETINL